VKRVAGKAGSGVPNSALVEKIAHPSRRANPFSAAAPARVEALFLPRPRGRMHWQGQSQRALRIRRQSLGRHHQCSGSRRPVIAQLHFTSDARTPGAPPFIQLQACPVGLNSCGLGPDHIPFAARRSPIAPPHVFGIVRRSAARAIESRPDADV